MLTFQVSFRHRYTKDVTRVLINGYAEAARYGHDIERYKNLLDGYTIRLMEFDKYTRTWSAIKVMYHKRYTNIPSTIPQPAMGNPPAKLTY